MEDVTLDAYDPTVESDDPMPYVHTTDGRVFDETPLLMALPGQVTLHYLSLCDISSNPPHVVNEAVAEWNAAMRAIREHDPDAVFPIVGVRLTHRIFTDVDMSMLAFTHTELDYGVFRSCNMSGCLQSSTRIDRAKFFDCRLDESVESAQGYATATFENPIGWTPPQPYITEDVARYLLREMIRDKSSELHRGLSELTGSGVHTSWEGDRFRFVFTSPIERMHNLCEDGECDCETHHACYGECECCACYSGHCDCEPDHANEVEHTDEFYLATVAGSMEWVWSDRSGMRIRLIMDEASNHPHINGASICLGSAIMPSTTFPADVLIMLMGWVGQHNPADEYNDIDNLPHIW